MAPGRLDDLVALVTGTSACLVALGHDSEEQTRPVVGVLHHYLALLCGRWYAGGLSCQIATC